AVRVSALISCTFFCLRHKPWLDFHVHFAVAHFSREFAQAPAYDPEQARARLDIELVSVPWALEYLAVISIDELARRARQHGAADLSLAYRRTAMRADIQHRMDDIAFTSEYADLAPADLDDPHRAHVE